MNVDPNSLPIGFLLNTLGGLVLRETQKEMEGIDLEVIELGILWLVDLDPGRPQAEYARFQKRDVSTFGRYVDKLQEKGFVTRNPVQGDRRAHALTVTPTGKAILTQGKRRALRAEKVVIKSSQAELDHLRTTLVAYLLNA